MRRAHSHNLGHGSDLSVAGSAIAYAQTETQQALSGAEIRFLQPAMPQFAALERFIPEFEEKFGIQGDGRRDTLRPVSPAFACGNAAGHGNLRTSTRWT